MLTILIKGIRSSINTHHFPKKNYRLSNETKVKLNWILDQTTLSFGAWNHQEKGWVEDEGGAGDDADNLPWGGETEKQDWQA